jgi:hypothetical protein
MVDFIRFVKDDLRVTSDLTPQALRMTIEQRQPGADLIHVK